jgi:hypothetical protein
MRRDDDGPPPSRMAERPCRRIRILIARPAQTPQSRWERDGALAIAVALSIRCTAQFRAPSGEGDGRARRDGSREDDEVEST